MDSADIMVNFEGTYDTYKSSYSAPSWVQDKKDDGTYKYEPSRFWHLVHTTKDETSPGPTGETKMKEVINLSKKRNAGYMYVTPDEMSNPWDTLPSGSYWETENSCLLATSSC